MEHLTVKQLEQLFKSEPFKFISLVDSDGNSIVAFNNPRINVDVRKKEIIKKLTSNILPDGIYTLKFRDTLANTNVKSYSIIKGKNNLSARSLVSEFPEPKMSEPKEKIVTIKEDQVLSYAEGLKMNLELAELRERVRTLEAEKANLEEELAEFDELAEGVSENNKAAESFGFFEKLLDKFVPIVDKHFEQKDKELQIAEMLAGREVAPKRGAEVGGIKQPIVKPQPAPAPAPAPNVFYNTPSGGGGGGGEAPANPAPANEEDEILESVIVNLPIEKLKSAYADMKAENNFEDLKKFIRILRKVRPEFIQEIVADDIK